MFCLWSTISQKLSHIKKIPEQTNYFQSNAHLSWKVGHFCTIFFRQIKSGWDFASPPLRSGQHFKKIMKDVECVGVGKIIKKFYDFYFSSYRWKFIENWGHFEYENDNNFRKKNCKIGNLIFLSFQPIPDLLNFKILNKIYFYFSILKILNKKEISILFSSYLKQKIWDFLFLLIPDIQIKILLIINKKY